MQQISDTKAAVKALRRLSSNTAALIPAEYADRLLNGESALRVYRNLCGLTQAALARKSGLRRVTIAENRDRSKAGLNRNITCPGRCARRESG
ncbi:hypothetical protein [Gemmobacter caeni]|jgi:mRNA interferase RelE/StbE|uniref:hypothetical protein n=1 Tax=Gemmobacter caeni TaxID=589035 RepID=UPI001F559F00|nr:hypothetical protein [Gemmobacter caeni]